MSFGKYNPPPGPAFEFAATAFAFGLCFLFVLGALSPALADGVRPQRFGPFLQQSLAVAGSPAGFRNQPLFGAYNFQAGWMEPIAILPSPIFAGSYLEAQGNANISPYQSDLGVAFNLKPIRFFEFGLGYNRLLFPYTLAGFSAPDSAPPHWHPSADAWRASKVVNSNNLEAAGTDVFTYQANVTVDVGHLQLHGGAFRSLWDVDIQDKDVLLEYQTDLLIRRRDRISSLYAQMLYQPDSKSSFMGLTAQGFGVREQYWWTTQTDLSQHLISLGFAGLHRGPNDNRRYQGFDGWVGFWLKQPQLEDRYGWERVYINLHWTWNIQILNLGER